MKSKSVQLALIIFVLASGIFLVDSSSFEETEILTFISSFISFQKFLILLLIILVGILAYTIINNYEKILSSQLSIIEKVKLSIQQHINKNPDKKKFLNIKNMNGAIAQLVDVNSNETVKYYYSLSGKQIDDENYQDEENYHFKELVVELLNNENLDKTSLELPLKALPLDSPFAVQERLSPELSWVKFDKLINEKTNPNSIIFSKYNNCTERKILHNIYEDYKEDIDQLKKFRLEISTESEPCLYCYKLLLDLNNSKLGMDFSSVLVFHKGSLNQGNNISFAKYK